MWQVRQKVHPKGSSSGLKSARGDLGIEFFRKVETGGFVSVAGYCPVGGCHPNSGADARDELSGVV